MTHGENKVGAALVCRGAMDQELRSLPPVPETCLRCDQPVRSGGVYFCERHDRGMPIEDLMLLREYKRRREEREREIRAQRSPWLKFRQDVLPVLGGLLLIVAVGWLAWTWLNQPDDNPCKGLT